MTGNYGFCGNKINKCQLSERRLSFPHLKIVGTKRVHSTSKCYLLRASFWVRGVTFQRYPFWEKSLSLIDGMVLVKTVRLSTGLFPWVATWQHWVRVTFFTGSQTKFMEIALEITNPQTDSAQSTWDMDTAYSWRPVEAFLQCQQISISCQQCVLSEVAEHHHTNKQMEKGTKLIGSPAPCANISSWSTPLTPRMYSSTGPSHLCRWRQ